MSPLITPTQQYIQQTCNKSQRALSPSVPTPIPTANPTRATHCIPTTPPNVYPPTKPSHHSIPIQALPTLNSPMTTVTTPLHDPTGWPSKSIHHVDLQIFHAKSSTMSSTLHSTHRLRILSCKLSLGCLIASSTVLTSRKCATGSFTP